MPDGDFGGVINQDVLRSFRDRLSNVEDDREQLNADAKEIYGEAREAGIHVPTLRRMVRESRMEAEARDSLYQTTELYRKTLGLYGDTPLGRATAEREASERPKGRQRRLKKTGDSFEEVEPLGQA